MKLLAIDPGPQRSAWMIFDTKPMKWGIDDNNDVIWKLLTDLNPFECEHMAIEFVQSFGMAVGAEVFETCFWAGRFCQAFKGDYLTRVFRSEVKMHLCRSMRAKDANIRQALIDRYGGKELAIGNKKFPGPLYGVSGHAWSCLAVAVTYLDTKAVCVSPVS